MSILTEAPATAIPSGVWTIDPVWSSLEFEVKKLGLMTIKGRVPGFAGTIVGGDAAYVGFTAGSGGLASNQRVTDFRFASLPDLTIERTGPGTFRFTWPIAVGNFLLQEGSSLATPAWANVATTVDLVNGRNHAVVSPQPGSRYFRLLLQ